MDDITALRQIDASHNNDAALFKPAAAIRVRTPRFTGTPMPKDEPTADNPPAGAIIDYVMPKIVDGHLTLTIFDASNQKICALSSADKPTASNAPELEFAPEWAPAPMILLAAPGMHRFVWDLHYPKPSTTACNASEAHGVWAPPGKYTIELNLNNKTYRQSLLVKADPRVKVPMTALHREFVLAQKVAQGAAQISTASDEAIRLLRALASRLLYANKPLASQIAALIARISDLSEVELQPDPRKLTIPPPRRTDSLRALLADLDRLERAVDGADADPSADALAADARLSPMVGATVRAWQQLKGNDLARLNAELTEAGEKPITP
jgi:hypothetical protein